MSNHPVKTGTRALRKPEREAIATTEVQRATSPFLSFHFSYTEVSAVGDKTYVRSKETRFEDGKLTSSEFEGTAERAAFDGWVRGAQQFWLDHTTNLLRTFFALPFAVKQRKPRRN